MKNSHNSQEMKRNEGMDNASPDIPILTKYLSDGTPLKVIDAEKLFDTLPTHTQMYVQWRYWIVSKFKLVRGRDYITEYGSPRPEQTRGGLPLKYYLTIEVAKHIAEYYANLPPRAVYNAEHTSQEDRLLTMEESEREEMDELIQILAEIAENYGMFDPLQSAAVAAEVVTGMDCFTHLGFTSKEQGYTAKEIGKRYGMSGTAINRKLVELGYHLAERNAAGYIIYRPVRIYSHLSAGYRGGLNGLHVWNGKIL